MKEQQMWGRRHPEVEPALGRRRVPPSPRSHRGSLSGQGGLLAEKRGASTATGAGALPQPGWRSRFTRRFVWGWG